MYGSSCGSPCLILHACRECHNTFTSPSSTSSQGQAGEESCSRVCVCLFPYSGTVAPYICMHLRTVYGSMRVTHVCLLCSRARRFVFIHVQTLVHLLAKPAVMLKLHHPHCSARLRRPLNLN